VYIRYVIPILGLMCIIYPRGAAAESFEESATPWQFVFKGRVIKIHAATLPQIRPTARTIIVKVDEVVQEPPSILGDYKGKEVTVQLSRPGAVRAGEQFVFFTTSWMYGNGIALRELDRRQPDAHISITRGQVAETQAKHTENRLQNRLNDAELVVSGRVSTVKPAPDDIRRHFISEHDPHWWEAVIEIDSVLKGQINERSVVVLFPSSRDVMWERAPKFREGQEGTWILRKEAIQGTTPPQEYFTAVHALDFHSPEHIERIKRLIR